MRKILLAVGVAFAMITVPITSFAQVDVGVSITLAPPPLPVYEQPPVPDQNDIWTPGYWAYGDAGYFWVPGTWVQAPQVGFLWTPAYWGFADGVYAFHNGYWGPHIGFYGGINYGYGYGGSGYQGGRWNNGQFAYNRSVNNITNTTIIKNVYNEQVTNTSNNHVSFNGGNGGVRAQPTVEERQFAAAPHVPPTSVQEQHQQQARADRNQLASVNHGAPAIAATPRPGVMTGAGVVHARAAEAQATPHGAPNEAAHPQVPQPPQHGQALQHQADAQSPRVPAPQHAQAMERQPMEQHAPAPQHAPAMERQPMAQHGEESQQHQAAPQPHQAAPQQHEAAPQQQHQAAPREAEPHQAEPHPAEARKGGDDKKPQ